tara:strand:- start:359 stop:742 length:384 start_codon:yes stop_codon:yes gene_type:complete
MSEVNKIFKIEATRILKEIDEPTKGNYKNIYLYSLSNMPERGWLQGCDYCGSITSKIILIYQKYYDKKNYYFYIYRCKSCKAKDAKRLLSQYDNVYNKDDAYKKDDAYNKYIDECIDYIKSEFSHIF